MLPSPLEVMCSVSPCHENQRDDRVAVSAKRRRFCRWKLLKLGRFWLNLCNVHFEGSKTVTSRTFLRSRKPALDPNQRLLKVLHGI